MAFEFTPLELPGLVLVRPRVFRDGRGLFHELYKRSEFARAGIEGPFIQDNCSHSARGVLRGLHYQNAPRAQGKLVTCLRGRIFDVAVDIRKGSPSFGKHLCLELDSESRAMLYVPPGFAHGFQVLSETAEVMYKCTEEYSPAHDRGILWCDPAIGIVWPIGTPVLSERDGRHPLLRDADNDLVYGQPA